MERRRHIVKLFVGRWSFRWARSALVASVALAAATLSLGFAQSALAGEPDTIEGTVTSAVTKDPIQGVEVCAGQECARTKADGTYVVIAHPVSLRVEFSAPPGSGFVAHTYYDGVYLTSKATELTVPVGETLTGIDAELQPEGRIEGVVTNSSTKAPIDGVEVCASPAAAWPEEPTCVDTNAQGVYEITGLAPIQYQLKFDPGALNYLPETPQRGYKLYPQVLAGSTTANVDRALPEGGQIEGLVQSAASGLPISGVQVCADGDGPSLGSKCAKTDAEGSYLIAGLETSSYYLSFWPERPYVALYYNEGKTVWVNQGETLGGANASLLIGTTISGVVTSASTGEPLREVKVCITEYYGGESNRGYCTEPDEAGEYELTGVATSTDTIEFYPDWTPYEYEVQYWDHVGVSSELTELHTTAGEKITGIDAALSAKFGVVAGRVLAVPGRQALSGAKACAENIDKSLRRCAEVNAQGEYAIKFLPSGRYDVEFYDPNQSSGYVTEFYNGKLSASEAEPVSVSPGRTTSGIDAELVERRSVGSSISGVVFDASGQQPIAGIEVCAYDANEEVELFGRCATTEANGGYSISGLPNGGYLVEFSSPLDSGLNYAPQYYDNTESLEQAIAVEVGPESADIGIDARMHEGGRVAGQAVDASTAASIAGISVCAYAGPAGAEVGACATTDQNGRYTIAGLPNGDYEVEFSVPPESTLDYVTQYYEGQRSATAATLVPVTAGETSSGIDARLQLGGRVTGRVTVAAGSPLANVLVCALVSLEEAVACTLSGSDGEYAIAGVPADSYAIGFDAGKSYVVQYYDDTSSYNDAQAVAVAAGRASTAIDAAMQVVPPSLPPNHLPLPKPVAPPPQQPSSSQSGATTTAQPSSPAVNSSPPAPSWAVPVVTALASKIVISGNSASLLLNCGDATCRGSVELTSQAETGRHGTKRTTAPQRYAAVLASGRFSLAKGRKAVAVLHLTAAGRRALAQAKRHRLPASLVVSVQGGKTIVRSVTVS